MNDLLRAIKFASRFKWLTFLNLLFSILSSGMNLIPPFIYKAYFDLVENVLKTGYNPQIQTQIYKYTVIYFIFILFSIFINRTSMYIWTKWMNETERSLVNESFSHIQSLSLDYFSKFQTGKIIERVSKGISDLTGIMESVVFQLLPQLIVFIISTVILFTYNIYFGLIVGFGVPAYIIITLLFQKKLIGYHDKIRDDYEKMGNVRTETIVNIRTVKSYVQEIAQSKKMSRLMDKKYNDNMQWARTANLMFTLRGITYYGSQFLAMILGVYLLLHGELTLGTFVLIWSYVTKAYEPMNYIMRLYDNTLKQLRAAKRLFETLDTKPTVFDQSDATELKVNKGEIIFNNVTFHYSDEKEKKVINTLNLTIKPKMTVAIVGKSGSGKTTLAKLLMRFYDLDKGQILIDGKDISDVTQTSLRENISYVLQDSSLFNDTVVNNIKFSNPKASLKQVEEAATIANADEFIKKLPKGYKTIVGERGVKLSGGEQQRINIARAVLKNSPILIFDEATSSLDSESELSIQKALDKLIENKTTIIIAHRLSTIMRADLIVVMDKGKIVETGTHKDLVEKQGIYSKLYEIQSGGYLIEDLQYTN